MLNLSLCGCHRAAPAVEMFDAARGRDPTRTYFLRARFRSEGDRRWGNFARTLREAVAKNDLLGLRGISGIPHGNKTEGFSAWVAEELRHKVLGYDGGWLAPFVAQAAAAAGMRAVVFSPGAVADPLRTATMQALAVSELKGIIGAAQQQIVRVVTHGMMVNSSPTRTANMASGVIRKMRDRTRAMAEYIVAKTHATTTLSAFRNGGVLQVGIIPERVRRNVLQDAFDPDEPRNEKGEWTSASGDEQAIIAAIRRFDQLRSNEKGEFGKGLGLRAAMKQVLSETGVKLRGLNFAPYRAKMGDVLRDAPQRTGPGSRSSRAETPSGRTIRRIRRAQAKLEEVGREVDVVTAGDDDVCQACQDIADGGPYDLDEAEGLIPAHNWCRCAFAPAGQYANDGVLYGRFEDFDPNEARDPHGRWTEGGAAGRSGGAGGDARLEEAQRSATEAAAGFPKLTGLPDKPIDIGDGRIYVPGPFGKAKQAAADYARSAGIAYDPPKQYLKVDKARATRIANAFDEMKHAPDDPAVKASYDALAKETLAQWQTIKATGLKVEWIKPGQADPYAKTPRLAAMDVTKNNHWWGFPTDLGYGTGDPTERHNNPMLQPTDEVVDGRKLVVNDVFRIVHDYFGHFKEGVGFRADGEENAWRSHAAMYSPLARGAMTSETRGQNSWVNYGPYGETNRKASVTDTHFADQKIGLMPEWTNNEGRKDIRDFNPYHEPAGSPTGGQFTSGESGGGGESKEPAQHELFPGVFPPLPEPKKEVAFDDFAKSDVQLDAQTRNNPEKGKKFIDSWNEHIGVAPEDFKKEFLGGLPATMHIHYQDYDDSIEVQGKLLGESGDRIGEYTRSIDFKENKASSDYFKLKDSEQGGSIGKQLLAANVEFYQKLGLDKVEVHANIDVGGYAWAKYGYVPTESSWRDLQDSLGTKLDELSGGSTYTPESWDELGSDQQDEVFNQWSRSTHDEFYDSEVTNWRDSGGDLAEAKRELAETNLSDMRENKWATDGLLKIAITQGEGADMKSRLIGGLLSERGSSIDQVLSHTTLEFRNRRGDGDEDADITIDATKTPELNDDEREQFASALSDVFNSKADDMRSDVDPPDYLSDNISDYQSEIWSSMRDRDKFAWARDNDALPEPDSSGESELDSDDAETLRDLLQSDDPKAIWAISDSAAGKKLLLDSDWYGEIDFDDNESMDRFKAYVSKRRAKAA